MYSIDVQAYMFSVTILSGIAIGFLFDIFRALRGIVRPRGLLSDAGDLAFWVLTTFFLSAALLFGNWGEVRLYVFAGIIIGLILYRLLASNVVVCGFRRIFYAMCLMKRRATQALRKARKRRQGTVPAKTSEH